MKFAVCSDVNIYTRAGNYVFYNIPLELARGGHEIYFFFPHYDWLKHPDVITPFNITNISGLKDAISDSDFVLWMCVPPGTSHWAATQDFYNIVKRTKKPLIYYALDYWEGWTSGAKYKTIWQAEEELVRSAHKHLAVSPQLCEYIASRYGVTVYWIPNGAAPAPTLSSVKKEQIVVISSSYYHHRSPQSIINLAKCYSDWIFVWAGVSSVHYIIPHPNAYTYPPNLIFVGEMGNMEFTELAGRASLGLVPAGRNWFSYFADPTKWYHYHMLKLPIVSVNTPHHVKFPEFYPNTWAGTDLFKVFRRAVDELGGVTAIEPLEFHTWTHRAGALLSAICDDKPIYGYADKNGGFRYTFKGDG